MTDKHFPDPEELQKEFEEIFRNRFGDQVKIFSHVSNIPNPEDHQDDNTLTEESLEPAWKDFNLKPREIKAYLDRFIIKQDEAKKALAIAVCDHYNFIKLAKEGVLSPDQYTKQNVLILGPTGVGKTYLIRQIAKLIKVPFVKADATRFSETGYIGANVDDLVRDLVSQANGNMEAAQYGIVYLDEADKLASPTGGMSGRDVSGRGVQIGLLKLMEETDIDLSAGNDLRAQLQAFMEYQQKGTLSKKVINTRNILFIVSGAFTGLEDFIKRRLNQRGIGFSASVDRMDEEDLLQKAATQDFIDYGFEPEFVGRLPVRVACHHLGVQDLYDILKNSEGSLIHQYQASFEAFNINLVFTDDGLLRIAEFAAEEKTGARALATVLERTLRNFKYELPSTDIDALVIDEETVLNPDSTLAKMLEEYALRAPREKKTDESKAAARLVNEREAREKFDLIQQYTEEVNHDAAVNIQFSPEAKDTLVRAAKTNDMLKERLAGFTSILHPALSLLHQIAQVKELQLNVEFINQPAVFLETQIKNAYLEKNESPI